MQIDLRLGDALTVLRSLPSESVDCVITSPPYWGLRDYGYDGQIGLEATLQDHLTVMVQIFREIRRVLKKTGTVWMNYGDAYACAPNGRSAADTKLVGKDDRTFRDKPISTIGGALKPKDRLMLPPRVAIALQDDGWWLRDEIVWHKPNPMPSSIRDRTTPAHEMIYMLTKSPRYYFDWKAILEPLKSDERDYKMPDNWATDLGEHHGTILRRGRQTGRPRDGSQNANPAGKRRRSVWTIPPRPFRAAHFATFPPDLIRPCVLAGCPEGGVVLDPFMGAGTTALVARELGRSSIGIEKNRAYLMIAYARLGITPPHFDRDTAEMLGFEIPAFDDPEYMLGAEIRNSTNSRFSHADLLG